MIKEISNFIDSLNEEFIVEGTKPANGLHIIFEVDMKNNKIIPGAQRIYRINKKGECIELNNDNEVQNDCYTNEVTKMESYSSYLTMNKALDTSRKIHSVSPYILWFKKKNTTLAKERFSEYFKLAEKYVSTNYKVIFNEIKTFAENNLMQILKQNPHFDKIKDDEYIKIYFKVDNQEIKNSYLGYLGDKIYAKDEFNITDKNGETFGLSNFLNTPNERKLFLLHRTSRFLVNNRITKNDAINLFRFEKLLKSKPRKLPNPFPLFIDKEELNNEVVRLYNREGVNSFQSIIKQLYEQRKEDLTKYYLINWVNTKDGLVLNDIDFVPSFRYEIKNMKIYDVMNIQESGNYKIDNIFHFEMDIVQKIFQNTLIVKSKKSGVIFKYFDDINTNYCRPVTYQNILRYRKNFYDFIYKSQWERLNSKIIYDIIISEILDEIKIDEKFKRSTSIKEKLNILFSLNDYFDKSNKNFGGLKMPTIIPEYLERLREIITDENNHFPQDDNFFAFAAGQLIYYIIWQSKTENKTHSLLEPYISKNSPEQFKIMITRGIDQFKHAFNFGYSKFEKLASEVLGYECKTNIKALLPVILAGYFSQNLLLEKNTTKE